MFAGMEWTPSLITFSVGLRRSAKKPGPAGRPIGVVIEKLIGRGDEATHWGGSWAVRGIDSSVGHPSRQTRSVLMRGLQLLPDCD